MSIKTPKNLKFCDETIQKKQSLEIGWLELASNLKEVRDNAFYEGRWESFEDFLADPEMSLDKASANKMIAIHEKLVLTYKIDTQHIANAGGWSKVSEVMPVITDRESAIEWLNQCESLSKDDLRKEVKEARSGVSTKECKHTNTYTIVVCRDCGLKMEDHD